MKTLFTDFPLGWDINPEKLEHVLLDLQDMGKAKIKYFKSTFSLLSISSNPPITRCEPASSTTSNHVEIYLEEKIIARFIRRKFGFKGILFEENIPEHKKKEITEIFAVHGYFTNKTVWKHARHMPIVFLGIAGFYLLMAAIYAYEIFLPSSILHPLPPEWYINYGYNSRTVSLYPSHVTFVSDIIMCVIYLGIGLYVLLLYKCVFTWEKF